MNDDNKTSLLEIIIGQLDDWEQRLFMLCSIPSYFTRDLITFCLPYLCSTCTLDSDIDRFLSLPFISQRSAGIGTNEIEYYMIHQQAKNAIPLSSEEYKKYSSILVIYFDMLCLTSEPPMAEKYFYEKLLCELKMGQIKTWRKAFQAAIELQRLHECDKLLELLCSSAPESIMEWCIYYKLVNRYANMEPSELIITELNNLISCTHAFSLECIYYLRLFLGILYEKQGHWTIAQSMNEQIQDEIQSSGLINHNIFYAVCANLAIIYCHTNNAIKATKNIDFLLAIDTLDMGLKISVYKTAGLCANMAYKWDKARVMYQHALQGMEEQLNDAKLDLVKIYSQYSPNPVYYSDEVGIYNRLGEILLLQGDFKGALAYHKKELLAQTISQSKTGIAWSEYNIGKTEYLIGNVKTAKEMLYNSISHFNKTDNKTNRAYPLGELSYVYQYIGQPNCSLTCLEKSVNLLLQSENIEKCLFYFNHLGRICQAQGFLTFASQIFEVCLQYYVMHTKTDSLGWVLNNYARNFMYLGDYSNSKKYFDSAEKAFSKQYNKRGLAYVFNNLAELYIKIDELDLAQQLFQKSLLMKSSMGDEHAICYTQRELGEFYLILNELNTAEMCLNQADCICVKSNYVMLKGDIYLSIGKLLRRKKNLKGAEEYFKNSAAIFKRQNFLTRMINCYHLQCELAEEMGCTEIYNTMQSKICNTTLRQEREEKLLIKNYNILMERVRHLISIP